MPADFAASTPRNSNAIAGASGAIVQRSWPTTTPQAFSRLQLDPDWVVGFLEPYESITFSAKAKEKGWWQNCAEMTGDLFFGTNIACFEGTIIK